MSFIGVNEQKLREECEAIEKEIKLLNEQQVQAQKLNHFLRREEEKLVKMNERNAEVEKKRDLTVSEIVEKAALRKGEYLSEIFLLKDAIIDKITHLEKSGTAQLTLDNSLHHCFNKLSICSGAQFQQNNVDQHLYEKLNVKYETLQLMNLNWSQLEMEHVLSDLELKRKVAELGAAAQPALSLKISPVRHFASGLNESYALSKLMPLLGKLQCLKWLQVEDQLLTQKIKKQHFFINYQVSIKQQLESCYSHFLLVKALFTRDLELVQKICGLVALLLNDINYVMSDDSIVHPKVKESSLLLSDWLHTTQQPIQHSINERDTTISIKRLKMNECIERAIKDTLPQCQNQAMIDAVRCLDENDKRFEQLKKELELKIKYG